MAPRWVPAPKATRLGAISARAEQPGQRATECLIYFGMPAHEFTAGLEALYTDLLALEAALISAAETGSGYRWQYLETIADEDRIDGYKLMAIRAVVDG